MLSHFRFAELRRNYPEPISDNLLQALVLFLGNRTHVANCVSSMHKNASLLKQSFVANQRFKMLFPVVRIIHNADQLSQSS